MKKFDRVKAVVSLDAIAHNFEEMKKNIAKGTKIVAVIKADGYGHGAEAIARLIEDYDYIWGYAIATPEEALQFRTGVDKPILILGIVFEEYFKELIANEIRITVCNYEMAAETFRRSGPSGKTGTYPYRTGYRNEPYRICRHTGKCRRRSKRSQLSESEDRGNVHTFCKSRRDRQKSCDRPAEPLSAFCRTSRKSRNTDPDETLLQQCRYHPCAGGKLKCSPCRYYDLWHLSVQ